MEVNGTNLLLKYRKTIMGVAAILIYVGHVWEYMFGKVPIISFVEYFVKMTGFVGVDFFLFLSGIGLFFAIQKYEVFDFYKRRLRRVYIPFVITAFAMLMINRWTWSEFFGNISGWNFLFKNIYTLLWFVPAIMIFYMIFPLYYKGFQAANNKYLFTGLIFVVWLLLSILLSNMMREDLYGFTNRIPVFTIGVLFGWLIQQQKLVFTKFAWILCVVAWILGIYLAFKTTFQGCFLLVPTSNCCIPNLLIATSGSFLLAKIFYFVDMRTGTLGRWSLRILEFFGMISLEFYCVQEWIGGIILNKLRGHHRAITINAAVFIGVLASTLVLYAICKLLERMFQKEK
ncbi:MAG: acyltransferase [Lachnospiraceae bacterium]|nr:acyltransferase [Lachnospiraceae bacterium]